MIYDKAPTVLSALGIEPTREWEGAPIKEIFESNLDVISNNVVIIPCELGSWLTDLKVLT